MKFNEILEYLINISVKFFKIILTFKILLYTARIMLRRRVTSTVYLSSFWKLDQVQK